MTATALQQQHWLQKKRQEATALFAQLPEPSRDKQDIGIVSSEWFDNTELQKSDSCIRTQLVTCPKDITCFDFATLVQHPQLFEIFQKYFGTLIPAQENKLHALHYAYVKNIVFIYAPKNSQGEIPVSISKYVSGNTALHHVVIVAEPFSKITVIEEEGSLNTCKDGYMSTFVEVVVQENAQVTYVSLQDYDHHVQHYIQKKAAVAKDARMDWIEAYFGGKYTRSTVTATLHEDGGASTNTTVFFGEDTQKFDIMCKTIQIGKHSFADMNTIGVVTDHARSMCRGLIKIEQPSFGSSGNQKIKTLLMNKDAQANAIPSMQIDNFDVRATHESTVGQISKEKLFYLMSRGLDEQHARMKIVEGYFTQITKILHTPTITMKIKSMIHKKLKIQEDIEQEFSAEEAETYIEAVSNA